MLGKLQIQLMADATKPCCRYTTAFGTEKQTRKVPSLTPSACLQTLFSDFFTHNQGYDGILCQESPGSILLGTLVHVNKSYFPHLKGEDYV